MHCKRLLQWYKCILQNVNKKLKYDTELNLSIWSPKGTSCRKALQQIKTANNDGSYVNCNDL